MFRSLIITGVLVVFAQSAVVVQTADAQGKGRIFGGRILGGNGGKYTYYSYQTNAFGTQVQPWQVPATGVRVYQYQNGQPVLVPGGLNSPAFQNIGNQGLYATWNMQGDQIGDVYLYPDQAAFTKAYQAGTTEAQAQLQGGRILVGNTGTYTYYPYQVQGQTFGTTATPFPTVADDVRVYQMKGNQKVLVPGGLKGEVFQNVGPQGLYGTWNVQGNRISDIYLYPSQQTFQQAFPATSGTGGTGNK